jgi:predicted transcriptional regulator
MTGDDRVVTAKLPSALVSKLDEVAARIDRSKSWIMRQALAEWLAEEERRHILTLEAMKDIDEGRYFTHEEVQAAVAAGRRRSSDG